jgi:GTP cyclohydrolase I
MIDFVENGIKPDTDTRYYKVERYNEEATAGIQTAIGSILQHLGEDTSRDGIVQTPMRVAKALQFCTQGYQTDPKKMLEGALFHENYSQMVLVKDIELYSLCEHHLLPFFGKAHVAYIPNGIITGLSKVARVVDAYARRLQVQERLTMQIRDCIQDTLHPLGVAVVIEAHHLCMMMRGVQKQNSVTTTSAFSGIFLQSKATREEFLSLIQRSLR